MQTPVQQPTPLTAILRESRSRLHPESRRLGDVERSLRRIGRPVSQEEVAQAASVSRQWYASLESGLRTGASIELLGRLADIFALGDEARGALIRAGVPELANTTMRPATVSMLDAFAWLRSCNKRLYSATSELEALTIATEIVAERFPDAVRIHNCFRAADGTWHVPTIIWGPELRGSASSLTACQRANLRHEQMDELRCYPRLVQPGDLGSERDLLEMDVWPLLSPVLSAHGCKSWTYLYGRVRTRNDWIGGIYVHAKEARTRTKEERAALSTVTELTSLVLA